MAAEDEFLPNLFVSPAKHKLVPYSSFTVRENSKKKGEYYIAEVFTAEATYAVLKNRQPALPESPEVENVSEVLDKYEYNSSGAASGNFNIHVGENGFLSGEIDVKFKTEKDFALVVTRAVVKGCRHVELLSQAVEEAFNNDEWDPNRRLVVQALQCDSMILTRSRTAGGECKLAVGAEHLVNASVGGGAESKTSSTIVFNPAPNDSERKGPFFTGFYNSLTVRTKSPRVRCLPIFGSKVQTPVSPTLSDQATLAGVEYTHESAKMGGDPAAAGFDEDSIATFAPHVQLPLKPIKPAQS